MERIRKKNLNSIGPESSTRPPTEVPRVGQDRQHRLQERHKTANKGPESGQDHPQRTRRSWEDLPQYFKMTLRSEVIGRCPTILQDDFEMVSQRKTAHIGPRSLTEALQLDDRPAIEKVEEKIQRQNMLTVSFGPED